jgi:hypothetical protein
MVLTSTLDWLITHSPVYMKTTDLGFLMVLISSLCNISVLSHCILWFLSQEYSTSFDLAISPTFAFHLCFAVLVFSGLSGCPLYEYLE